MFTIQRLTAGDTNDIEQLEKLVRQQLSNAATSDSIKKALQTPQSIIFVARTDNGTIVGTATLATTACLTGLRSHIEDVVVDTAFRRQGIARQLLRSIITYAHDTLHVRTIDLTSRPERTAANALYKEMGFVERESNVYRYNRS